MRVQASRLGDDDNDLGHARQLVGSCSPTKDQTQALSTGNRALATGPPPYIFGEPLVAQTVKNLPAA